MGGSRSVATDSPPKPPSVSSEAGFRMFRGKKDEGSWLEAAFYHGTHGNALRVTLKEVGKECVFTNFGHNSFSYLFTVVCSELLRIIILHLCGFVQKCSDVKSHIPIRGSMYSVVGGIPVFSESGLT